MDRKFKVENGKWKMTREAVVSNDDCDWPWRCLHIVWCG